MAQQFTAGDGRRLYNLTLQLRLRIVTSNVFGKRSMRAHQKCRRAGLHGVAMGGHEIYHILESGPTKVVAITQTN